MFKPYALIQTYRFEFVHHLIVMLSIQEVPQVLSVNTNASLCQGTYSFDEAKTQNMIVESDECHYTHFLTNLSAIRLWILLKQGGLLKELRGSANSLLRMERCLRLVQKIT